MCVRVYACVETEKVRTRSKNAHVGPNVAFESINSEGMWTIFLGSSSGLDFEPTFVQNEAFRTVWWSLPIGSLRTQGQSWPSRDLQGNRAACALHLHKRHFRRRTKLSLRM